MRRAAAYTQCSLEKDGARRVAWIPTVFAKRNQVVKLDGDDGWKVVCLYQTADAAMVEDHEMDYRKQRRASDI